MAESSYLKPKVKVGDLSKRDTKDGQFRNPPTYTPFGGFTSASKLKNDQNDMSVEKSPGARAGKPI